MANTGIRHERSPSELISEKLTFAKGASLKDPTPLFNASLDGNVRRAIDIHRGDKRLMDP